MRKKDTDYSSELFEIVTNYFFSNLPQTPNGKLTPLFASKYNSPILNFDLVFVAKGCNKFCGTKAEKPNE
jgi:hypothetical protein